MAEWRQRAERFLLPLPLRYRISGASEWSRGRARNISGSGLLFGVARELPVGTQLEMHVAMEAGGRSYPSEIIARAQVVRIVAPQSSSSVALAASFETYQMFPRAIGQA